MSAAAAAAASAAEDGTSSTISGSVDGQGAGGISRKERKRIETQEKYEAELREMQKQAENVHVGESPFSVSLEEDASNTQEGSRNISLNKVSVSVNGKTIFTDTQVKFSAGARYGLM